MKAKTRGVYCPECLCLTQAIVLHEHPDHPIGSCWLGHARMFICNDCDLLITILFDQERHFVTVISDPWRADERFISSAGRRQRDVDEIPF